MRRTLAVVLAGSCTLTMAVTVASAETAAPAPGATPFGALSTEVVGGTIVPEGRWPDTAGVFFGNDVGCTGVLVAPTVVLTAGHCIDGSVSKVLLNATDVGGPGETIRVIRRIAYPNWYNTMDIGILILETPSQVTPRRIASGCIKDNFVVDGATVTIVGYGAIDVNGNEYRSELREAVTTITDADCSQTSRGCVSSVQPDGELGAGGDGIDSCFGDSGGPLYLMTDRGEFLVGLTSRGYDDVNLPCAEGGIYVKPEKVIDWIQEQTGETLVPPSCNAPPVPTTPAIEVEAGDNKTIRVEPNDPDVTDTHQVSVQVAPEHGTIEVGSDGSVTYSADADYLGPDAFTVAVTDNGDPALTGTVVVAVTVIEATGCGCQSGRGAAQGAWVFALAGLVAIGRRRKLRA